ncbi:MAG: hypothetical protein JO019_03375 [Candidatus Kaiserbacteria bacterium]|nr:hypothetical protein [Candidatus Kaiserbacteria bacterium]
MRALRVPLALLFLAAVIAAIAYAPRLHASAAGDMSGYAWSENIGWISLNCATGGPTGNNICNTSNYKLTVDQNGKVSGYAWSDNVGWISANDGTNGTPNDLAGCPSNPCWAKFNSGQLTGWLRALAGTSASAGGWDGWISLSGSNPTYGVSESNGIVTGYAWGGTNVGWIDFSGSSPFGPACTLTPSQSNIVRGNTTSLNWTSSNANSGTINPGNLTASPVASGSVGVQPNATTTYTATFTGSGGNSQCQATINVSCAPVYSCSGQQIQYTDAGCNVSNVGNACASPSFCTAGQSTCQWPPIDFVPFPGNDFNGHLQARPNILHQGEKAKLYWQVDNATSCTVTGGGQSWSELTSGPSGVQTNAITEKTTYKLHCSAYQGQLDLSETVDILVQPKFEER